MRRVLTFTWAAGIGLLLDAILGTVWFASRCSVPTRVDVQLRERQSAEIEAVAYCRICATRGHNSHRE